MRTYRLSQVARTLNLGTKTIVEILEQNDIFVFNKPNTKLTNEHIKILCDSISINVNDKFSVNSQSDQSEINSWSVLLKDTSFITAIIEAFSSNELNKELNYSLLKTHISFDSLKRKYFSEKIFYHLTYLLKKPLRSYPIFNILGQLFTRINHFHIFYLNSLEEDNRLKMSFSTLS